MTGLSPGGEPAARSAARPARRSCRLPKVAGRGSSSPPSPARPACWRGRPRYWAATGSWRGRSWPWSPGHHRGATLFLCSHAPSGAARFAAASSSKGFRASSTHPTRPPPSSSGSRRPPSSPTRSCGFRQPTRPICTDRARLLIFELLGGGRARLPRLPGNSLVLRRGRPVLIIEAHAKRLTALPSSAKSDIDSALNFLPSLTGADRRVLKVEMYNGAPVIDSLVATHLAKLGFVRDYPGMTYYAGWSQPPPVPEDV